jgi:4-hydroxybenzoate polyprenyltransferase
VSNQVKEKVNSKGTNPANKWWIYQKERFPLFSHGVLILCFSAAAVSFSLRCGGISQFISFSKFLPGYFIILTLFMLLRISDEFKDAEIDFNYRSHLPVPRGLIKLSELKYLAYVIIALQLAIQVVFIKNMLWLYIIVLAYLILMHHEFFVKKWLIQNQLWYVVSHMMIIPIIDIYASGLDWNLQQSQPSTALAYFFAVSFFNGTVLEVGRKIKIPSAERTGVETYSSMLGLSKSIALWLVLISITAVLATKTIAISHSKDSLIVILWLVWLCSICPAIIQWWSNYNKTQKDYTKAIEIGSGIWAIMMYILLGDLISIIKL